VKSYLIKNTMSTRSMFFVAIFVAVNTLPAIGRPGNVNGVLLSGPMNQTVSAGTTAVLTCGNIPTHPDTKCHWLKDGFLIDTGGRYHVSESCELTISPVLPLDQGQYHCQLGGARPMMSGVGTLSVDTEPGHPDIQSDDVIMVHRGDMTQLHCQSSGGRPAAEIQWWNADTGHNIVSEVISNVHKQGETFVTKSTLKMKVNNHMKVYCTAHSEAFPELKQSSPVELAIRGEPRVETISLREGDSVKIFCHNRLTDDVAKFKWFINNNQISGEHRDVLEITDFTKSYDKSIIKCVVMDTTGRDETVRQVELRHDNTVKQDKKIVAKSFQELVKRKPKAKKTEVMMNDEIVVEDVLDASKGTKTTFICVVEDDDSTNSDEPKYVWVDGKLTKKNSNDDVSTDKRYKCKVVKNGVRKINKMAKDLKTYSKSMKKMSRYLNEFSSY